MAELAVKTKKMDFHLEQVQDFTPTPMTVATETWYSGYDPYTLEPVYCAKSQKEKLAQRQFFFWYKPSERQNIERELRRMHREDLIKELFDHHADKPRRHMPTSSNEQTKETKGKKKSYNPNLNNQNANRHKQKNRNRHSQ